jgi:hypothetical protein
MSDEDKHYVLPWEGHLLLRGYHLLPHSRGMVTFAAYNPTREDYRSYIEWMELDFDG